MVTRLPEKFVLGQMHHRMSFQLVVVPGHTKQTLLKQSFVSRMSLIISNLGVPVATHSCPPPALSSAFSTNVLHHPSCGDVGQSDHQGQLLTSSNRPTSKPDGISSNKFQAISFGLCAHSRTASPLKVEVQRSRKPSARWMTADSKKRQICTTCLFAQRWIEKKKTILFFLPPLSSPGPLFEKGLGRGKD